MNNWLLKCKVVWEEFNKAWETPHINHSNDKSWWDNAKKRNGMLFNEREVNVYQKNHKDEEETGEGIHNEKTHFGY